MNRFKDQRGQALVMSVAFLTVLVGCAALVLDVGSWYRADRHAQTTADAAALAGAQGLNESAGLARTLAQDYADKNGGGVTSGDITITGGDTVRVQVNRPAPGFFAKLFGLDSVRAHAVAAARVASGSSVAYAVTAAARTSAALSASASRSRNSTISSRCWSCSSPARSTHSSRRRTAGA